MNEIGIRNLENSKPKETNSKQASCKRGAVILDLASLTYQKQNSNANLEQSNNQGHTRDVRKKSEKGVMKISQVQ